MAKDHLPFDPRLDLLAAEPGVYLMKDASGSVIYVGKAKNLPVRLRSYFTEHPQGTAKVLSMIKQIASFETITCSNELEAFMLENSLIKEHQPKYNILLRDDKEYPYIRVTMNEAYPRVLKSFYIQDDVEAGARYFGPYLAGDLRLALEALGRIFPLKRCRRIFPRDIGKERPCLDYHIGRCIGPCVGDVSQAAYRALCSKVCEYLEGQGQSILAELEAEMHAAAERLAFEQAARLRDRLEALKRLRARQVVADAKQQDSADFFALARNASEVCVQIMKMREGRIVSAGAYFVPDQDETEAEILEAFVRQHYLEKEQVQAQIYLSAPLETGLLEAYLRQWTERAIRLHRPQRGHKFQVMEMARRNAKQSLARRTLLGPGAKSRELSLKRLQELCQMRVFPQRLEIYDISNLGDSDRAGSMVVFLQGRPQRKLYRHFKIKEGQGQDDYAAMAELIQRRLERLDDAAFGQAPHLILLDGGKGHLSSVSPLLKAHPAISLAALVKDDRHRTRALLQPDGSLYELQAPEGDEDPDLRAERRGLLRLLTAMQDEAHRFAGRLNKSLGKKRQLRWTLETVPGIGPARRRALLKHFGSMQALSEAPLETIQQTPGLPADTAQAVYDHFHRKDAP